MNVNSIKSLRTTKLILNKRIGILTIARTSTVTHDLFPKIFVSELMFESDVYQIKARLWVIVRH